jgi:hypothetical protein
VTQPSPGREPRLIAAEQRDSRAGRVGPIPIGPGGYDTVIMAAVMS